MSVRIIPEANDEWQALPVREREAMRNAFRKLQAAGAQLGYPHSSAVKSVSEPLRELRPRSGRSAWRAFYARIGDDLVIAAIGPEAEANPRGFERTVAAAVRRLKQERES